ncbi:MAG: hypothetical protein V4460_09950 [Pseudomonadota bacterium]|jgi:hypothetical protein
MSIWDGIYVAYMTGSEGQGFGMFVFDRGVLVGADPLGVTFSGNYVVDDAGALNGDIEVSDPANGTVIQGVSTGNSKMTYSVSIKLSAEDLEQNFFQITTPLGPVNIKLEKLTSLEVNE